MRWDYLKGSAPAIDAPAGVWVPARHFDAADNIPNWKDWSPRVGAAYDLFGNGKTAIKGAVGRYVAFQNNAGIISANAPASRLSLTDQRSWADNGDYIVQESELGPSTNANFGTLVTTTTYSPDLLTGNRPYSWQASLQVQQDIGRGLALNFGYFRTWYGNQTVTRNRAVTAADFDPYCVTASTNALLPGGGGNQICGLFDVKPAKVRRSDTLIDLASKYGDPSQVYNGVDVNLTARLGGGSLCAGRNVDWQHDLGHMLCERSAGPAARGQDDGRTRGRPNTATTAPHGRAGRSSKPLVGDAAAVGHPGQRELSEQGADQPAGE